MSDNIQLFENQPIRTAWDEEKEEWYFSVVDAVRVLTDSKDPLAYWRKLKQRLRGEGNETVTNCHALKMTAADGKKRMTDVADTEQLLRIIQSIPSPKAEPFKLWLAQVGRERIEETIDPERAIDRALETYLKKGYSEEWVHQRLLAIRIRNELTDEWQRRGVEKGKEYAILTDSGCDLPEEFLGKLGVTCVELRVMGERGNERILPPDPAELAATYRSLVEVGASAVLSIHSSSQLSDAVEWAVIAAEQSGVPVEVIDSGCVSVALGIVVDCVATAKANGATLGEAVSVALKVAEETRILFIPAKGALPEDLHGLGRQGGLLAGMASLRRRIAGERRLLSIRRGELPVELFANVDPSDLTGRAVRTVSRASQEIGPVYYALVDARAGRLLHLLEKPLDTNEFEHSRLGVVLAGTATLASAGEGAIALAYVPQAVYDAASGKTDPTKPQEG